MGQRRNQEQNKKKILGPKLNWRHNITKSLEHIKSVLQEKFIDLSAYIKMKQKEIWTNDLTTQSWFNARNQKKYTSEKQNPKQYKKWFNDANQEFGKTRINNQMPPIKPV